MCIRDSYKEVYDSMYAGIEQLKPGNTTADVVKKFPHYDDDEYTTVTLQQFAHSIGITLYEGMWMSRAYSMKYPCLLYTSDAADERSSVDLGGRRIIKK